MKHLIEQLEAGSLEEAVDLVVEFDDLKKVLKRKFKPKLPKGMAVEWLSIRMREGTTGSWGFTVNVDLKWGSEDLTLDMAEPSIRTALESAIGGQLTEPHIDDVGRSIEMAWKPDLYF